MDSQLEEEGCRLLTARRIPVFGIVQWQNHGRMMHHNAYGRGGNPVGEAGSGGVVLLSYDEDRFYRAKVGKKEVIQ